jgi:type IV pilus assembly protein PilV
MIQVSQQTGVGMVEILVTLFILALGLLGVASLQFVSAFSNADALNRSQAVMVAQQLSERLRANATMSPLGTGMVVDNTYLDANQYNFNNLSCSGDGLPHACFCQSLPPSITDCATHSCYASQFASYDAHQLSCAAVANNPDTQIRLTCTDTNTTDIHSCSAGSRYQILLRWPVQSWQNHQRILNSECNTEEEDPHDCVVLEVTL